MTLFGVFGASIVLAAIALYAMNSPAHQLVPNRVSQGLAAGRLNVLVIGSSPSGKSIATQSLTLVSLRPGAKQAAMISIPRDLWVRIGHFGNHRLGAALNIGANSGYPGEGPGLMSDTVESITGQPIHAFIRVDTADLRSTIDSLGGIDIEVQHTFWERSRHDHFVAGRHHMSGERAVRYAQSTAVKGPQAGRFARELRQQQVIAAVLDQISRSTPDVRARAFGSLTATNLTPQQIEQISATINDAGDVKYATLEPLTKPFEVQSFFDGGGEAVQPRSGDYASVQALAANVFAVGAQPIATIR
jgi:LCP family protein required for cell wall assembly